MMGWYHDGLGWGGWLLMTVAMVAFWGLAVVAVLALFRSDATTPRRSPEDVLDERFARGELTEQEYRSRRDTLHEIRRNVRHDPAVHP